MIRTQESEKLKILIQEADTIAIFGHENVDGDAVGSILALGAICQKLSKKTRLFTTNTPSDIFLFLEDIQKVETNFDYGTYDLMIFCDFTPYSRIRTITQEHTDYFDKQKIIIIDHHVADTSPNTVLTIRDTDSIATCEMLTDIILQNRPKLLDANIATYLYLGLATDSGNFLFPSDYTRTFAVALSLIQAGADKDTITMEMFRSKSFDATQYMQVVLSRMQRNESQSILWAWTNASERNEYGVQRAEAKFALNMMQDIRGPLLIVLFEVNDYNIKLHLRSKGVVNCQKIAQSFGGGGHVCASGATVSFGGTYTIGNQEFTSLSDNWKSIIELIYTSLDDFLI